MNNENNNLGNQIPTNNQIKNNGQFINPQTIQPQVNSGIQQPQMQPQVNSGIQQPQMQPQVNSGIQQPQIQPQVNSGIQQQQMQSQLNSAVQQPQMQSQLNSAVQQPQMQTQVNGGIQQPQMSNNFNQNKKTNKKLFIIIGICIAILIAIATLIIVLLTGNDKKKNKNEYENNNTSNEQTETNSSTNIQSYKGFNFKKVSGYEYIIKDNVLVIGNNQYGFFLSIIAGNFDSFKTGYQTNISNDLKSIISGQTKLQSYSNVEVATYEISMNGNNAIYFILPSPNKSYCFEGYVMTPDNTFDYKAIDELVKLTSNSEYTGNFTNYSSDFGNNTDVKDLIEN